MKQSLVGFAANLRAMADALQAMADAEEGGDDAPPDMTRFAYNHQPRLLAFTAEELLKHLRMVKANPALLPEFFDSYILD